MKKRSIISLALVLAFCLSLFTPAMATNSLSFSLTPVSSKVTTSDEDQTVVVELTPSKALTVGSVTYKIECAEGIELIGIACEQLGFTGAAYNIAAGSVNWYASDADLTNITSLGTFTFKVPANTSIGDYEITVTGIELTEAYVSYGTGSSATATITVEEPSAPPVETVDYEIYYTLSGSGFNGTSDGDTYTDYNIGDTVTAEVFLKNNTGSAIDLQAYDLYLTYDSNLTYQSHNLTSGAVYKTGNTVTHIQAVGTDTTKPISVALPAGTAVSLGTITFTINPNAVYNTQMPITLTVGKDSKTVTNIGVGTADSGNPTSYYPADTSEVDGAEVMTAYTVDFNTDGGSEVGNQTVGHNLTATKPATDPTKENYSFKGWYSDNTYTTEFNFENTKITKDTTVYAKWEQDNFKVYWYNTNGSEIYNANVKAGSTTSFDETTFAKPTKAADERYTYTFKGWSTDSNAALNAEIVDLITYKINAETKFYPVFSTTTNTYTVTWNNWDNSLLEKDEGVEYGATPTYDGDTPTREATAQYEYEWSSWTPSVNTVTGDITYTATFTEKTRSYTVTYAEGTNGTLNGETTETVEYGKTPASVPAVTPLNGYKFTGWSDGTTTYTDLSNYTVSGPATLTAQYELIEYTITLNVNGGDALASSTITYDITDTVILPAATKTGATFDGWKLDLAVGGWEATTYTAGEYTNKYGTITLVAQWSNKDYTITTGSVTGGTVTPRKTSANYGEEITLTYESEDGYNFVEYVVTDASGNSVAVTGGKFTMPASNVTVSATFDPIDYTVTVVTPANGTVTASKTTQAHVGDVITLTSTANTGYRWVSYTVTDASGASVTVTDGKFTMPAASVTVTATFTGIPYQIQFDCNGGNQSTMNPISTAYGETVTLTKNVFTKTGYTFLGWSTDPDATAATHADEARVSDLSSDGTVVTLYAIWKANTDTKYVVNHYKQDIDVASNQVKDTYTLAEDEELTGTSDAKVTPAVKAYDGFTAPNTQTVTIKADGTTVVNYYYTRNTYTVNLDANYVEGTNSNITVIYGSTYAELDTLTRDGYTFVGWFDAATGGSKVEATDTVEITANTTLYAHWTVITYTITFDTAGGDAIASVEYNIERDDQLPEPTKANCTFSGWKPEVAVGGWQDGSYNAGTSVKGKYGNVKLVAQWTEKVTYKIEDYAYAGSGYVMLRVKNDVTETGNVYKFGEQVMYYTTDSNYLINSTDTGVFYTLIDKSYVEVNGEAYVGLTDEGLGLLKAVSGSTTEINYDGDINGDGVINIADANVVYQMIVNGGDYYNDLSSDTQSDILSRLKADMVKAAADHRGSIEDVGAIVTIINT